MATHPHPELIYGTAVFGMGVDNAADVHAMLSTLQHLGVTRLDTAARYPPTSPGRSETLLREAGAPALGFTIDSKVLARPTPKGDGELAEGPVEESVGASLERLGVESVNVLYCHRPDPTTPIEEQARVLDAQYRQGRFSALGVSNFSTSMIEQWMAAADKHGYIKPTYYQGEYNVITRGPEKLLFPTLRKFGMRFVAFRAIGGGFMSGKLVHGEVEGTRFDDKSPLGNAMQKLFEGQGLLEAFLQLEKTTKAHDITTVAASLRWLAYHSALNETDAILLGATKTAQLEDNVAAIKQGPLSGDVLKALESMWESLEGTRSTQGTF